MSAGFSTPSMATIPPAPAGPESRLRAEAIYAEQVRHLYRLSRLGYVGTLVSAAIVAVALWDVLPTFPLVLWCSGVLGVTAAQYVLYRIFSMRRPGDSDVARWGSYFISGTAAMGLMWGLLGSVLYPSGSMPHEFLVMFLIGGLVVSALVGLAPVHQAFLAFVGPALLPTIPTVFLQGTTLHFYMGVLMMVFLIIMLATGPIVSEMIRQSLGMKFENSELLAQLSEIHAASKHANLQLNEQVYAQRVTAEQLRQASQKLGARIEASPHAIVVRDVEGRVESWNSAAELIFGWTQEELRGKDVPFLPPGREEEGQRFRERTAG
jgi:PAS domain-containing protein